MCGINGIISNKRQGLHGLVNKMNKFFVAEHTNDFDIWNYDNIAFAYQNKSADGIRPDKKLSIVSDCGRYAAICCGKIINLKSLAKLFPYPYKTRDQHEVILAAWKAKGKEAVPLFEGNFVIALWDKKENSLTLVRDRMGVKPLYYSLYKGDFVFSSSIRALLTSKIVEATIDENSLVDYLRYQTVHSPATIIKDVSMLEPASILEYNIDRQQIKTQKYWSINSIRPVFDIDREEAKHELRNLFFKSVENCLESDVSLGAFLSGGIDSSAVVGAMAQLSAKKIKTFNISFAEKEYSEAPYARFIADMHNTEHFEIQLTASYFLKYLPEALKEMDHPGGDGTNTWMISKAVKSAGIDVALSGLGGDELFCGYPIFLRMQRLNKMQYLWRLPTFLRRFAGKTLSKVKPGIASSKIAALLSTKNFDFNAAYIQSRQVLSDPQIEALLSHPLPDTNLPLELLNEMGETLVSKDHIFSRVSIAEMLTYMQNVLLRDSFQMAAAHSLELRIPFADHKLIEYTLSLPDSIKYPSSPKKLLVDSMPDILPSYIVQRPKMGFVFPWEQWLKNELHDYASQRIISLGERKILDKNELVKLWTNFNNNHPQVTFSRIWPLIVLEEWLASMNNHQ